MFFNCPLWFNSIDVPVIMRINAIRHINGNDCFRAHVRNSGVSTQETLDLGLRSGFSYQIIRGFVFVSGSRKQDVTHTGTPA